MVLYDELVQANNNNGRCLNAGDQSVGFIAIDGLLKSCNEVYWIDRCGTKYTDNLDAFLNQVATSILGGELYVKYLPKLKACFSSMENKSKKATLTDTEYNNLSLSIKDFSQSVYGALCKKKSPGGCFYKYDIDKKYVVFIRYNENTNAVEASLRKRPHYIRDLIKQETLVGDIYQLPLDSNSINGIIWSYLSVR